MATPPEGTPSSPTPGSQPLAVSTASEPAAELVPPLKDEETHSSDKAVSKGWKIKLYELFRSNNELVVAVCTVVIAFASIGSWYVANQQSGATSGQLRVMEQQLTEMKGNSTQTDNLIKQATKQAEALTAQVEHLKLSVEAATRQSKAAEEANRISANGLVINKNAIDETLKLTRQGLALSRQSLIASQRAWLIPKAMTVAFKERSVAVTFRVSNTGRSPATQLRGFMRLSEEGSLVVHQLPMPKYLQAFPNTLIGPGAENDHSLTFNLQFAADARQEHIKMIETGKRKSRIIGSFFYSDEYESDRVLPICGIYEPNQTAYNLCPTVDVEPIKIHP